MKLYILKFVYRKVASGFHKIFVFFEQMADDHAFLIASGIAFSIFLYLIPIALVVIYIITRFIDANAVILSIDNILRNIFPQTESSQALISTILNEIYSISMHSRFFGIIGIIVLLWLSSTVFSSLRTGLNAMFHFPSPRFFLVYKLKDIVIAITLSFLIMLSTFILPASAAIVKYIGEWLPDIYLKYFQTFSSFLLTIFIGFIFFIFIFRFLPNKKLPNKILVFCTVFCVGALEVAKPLFAYYVSYSGSYGKFYGVYAALVTIAVWLYYSAIIILISATLGYNLMVKKKTHHHSH
ncbi:MAG: putative rane protein [Ignavibacteria bacterium]|nr:putative rane protein [Ignavibacteria bacterium]